MNHPARPTIGHWRVRVALPRDLTRADWWREQWRRNPRLALALRAALAAAVAWSIASVLPGPAADYPYYAPFGAVIATTFTLAGSVRESLQSVGAIMIGGLIGWLVDFLPLTVGPLKIALVVVPAVVLAGWRRLGGMGGWVPTAALFTLIIGYGEATYVGAYAGLTLLGALIGIGVNALFPPLPLAPAQSAVRRYRRMLSADLTDLADLLNGAELPTLAEWQRDHDAAPRERAQMHTRLSEVGEASQRNLRARRYSASIEGLQHEGATLDRLALTVNDLADLLLSDIASDTVDRSSVLAGDVGAKVREALRALATALDNVAPAGTVDRYVQDETEPTSSDDAAGAVRAARRTAPREDDKLLIDGILISLKRAVDSLVEIERAD